MLECLQLHGRAIDDKDTPHLDRYGAETQGPAYGEQPWPYLTQVKTTGHEHEQL